MTARSLVPYRPGFEVIREGTSRNVPISTHWKVPRELDLITRVDVLRQQYLDGTLFFDEREVARKILLRVLNH